MTDYTHSFLYQQFLHFYRELAALVGKIERQNDPVQRQNMASSEYESLNHKTVSDKLMLVLDRQAALVAGNRDAVEPRLFEEARYVMVAVADEMFLDLNWPDREAWGDHLLEEQLVGSQAAGDLLFVRLEQLLALNGPVYEDLAKVYLTALALGFRGRYRAGDPHGELEIFRRRLYAYIFKREPDPGSRTLFPQNHEVVYREEKPRHLPTVQRLLKLSVAMMAAWVIGTSAVWWLFLEPVRHLVAQIVALR